MVTLGFSIAVVLFLLQEYFIIDSTAFSSSSLAEEKFVGNKFHGQINVNVKKTNVDNQDVVAPVNFKQRNLQKTGSGSNAASGIGENVFSTRRSLMEEIKTR